MTLNKDDTRELIKKAETFRCLAAQRSAGSQASWHPPKRSYAESGGTEDDGHFADGSTARKM